jgi:hypothetical protein
MDKIMTRRIAYMCVAVVGMAVCCSMSAYGAPAKASSSMVAEYLDPFDLSVKDYQVPAKADKTGKSNSSATSTSSRASAVAADASAVEVVSLADATAVTSTSLLATSSPVIRVRVMVRIPFKPVLRSPCTPIV